MKKNVGKTERLIRVILGLVILATYFTIEGDGRYWALLGLFPLLTGLSGWCPPFALFGINTRKKPT